MATIARKKASGKATATGPRASAKSRGASTNNEEIIELETFLPYRLNMLASQVAAPLAARNAKLFDLSVPEWRAMAVLGRYPGLSALDMVTRSGMDKVAVSRALTRLEECGRVQRTVDLDDRRRNILNLTDEGWALYRKAIPFAKRIEVALTKDFSPTERAALFSYLDRLSNRLASLTEDELL